VIRLNACVKNTDKKIQKTFSFTIFSKSVAKIYFCFSAKMLKKFKNMFGKAFAKMSIFFSKLSRFPTNLVKVKQKQKKTFWE
jgi:hypothetical protein